MSANETKSAFLTRRESARIVAKFVSPINSVDDLKRAACSAGSNWFSPGAMSWFKSRVLDGIYAGRYFISSECNTYGDNVRRYSIREFAFTGYVREDGRECVKFHISTVGEFGEYDSAADAKRAVRALVFPEVN